MASKSAKSPASPSQQQQQQHYGFRLPSAAFAKVAPHSHLAAHLGASSPIAKPSPFDTDSTNQQPSRPPRRPLRPSGRTPSQFRSLQCTTNSLSHCAGSAVVRLGDGGGGGTSVVCGIQAEVVVLPSSPDDEDGDEDDDGVEVTGSEIEGAGGKDEESRREEKRRRTERDRRKLASLNLLVPNVDLSSGADADNLPTAGGGGGGGGGGTSAEAQVLSSRILSLLLRSDVISLEALRICGESSRGRRRSQRGYDGGEDMEMDVDTSSSSSSSFSLSSPESTTTPTAYWTLQITLLPLSISGRTSLFDALWASLIAALRSTRLPQGRWDEDVGSVICDPDPELFRPLCVSGCPIAASWGIFRVPKGVVRTVEGSGKDGESEEGVVEVHADTTMHNAFTTAQNSSLASSKDAWNQPRRLKDGTTAYILADPEAGEDELCRETVTVVVDCGDVDGVGVRVRDEAEGGVGEGGGQARGDGSGNGGDGREKIKGKSKVIALEKKGGPILGMGDIAGLIGQAGERWGEVRGVLP